jgi:hypothetical protein
MGKSNTNNLPAPTDLTENPYKRKNTFFERYNSKIGLRGSIWDCLALEPRRPIFEKCPHLREKGGVLTLRTPVGFMLTHTVPTTVLNLVYYY